MVSVCPMCRKEFKTTVAFLHHFHKSEEGKECRDGFRKQMEDAKNRSDREQDFVNVKELFK